MQKMSMLDNYEDDSIENNKQNNTITTNNFLLTL